MERKLACGPRYDAAQRGSTDFKILHQRRNLENGSGLIFVVSL